MHSNSTTIENKQDGQYENEIKIGNMFSMLTHDRLGGGAFGEIYKGYNMKTKEEVAVKIESHKSKTPQLNYESKILKLLQGGGNITINIP
jgi:casein kinase 1